jgi:hypothetical protein
MSDPTIKCPSCHAEIRLNESLAAPLIDAARRELEERAQLRERVVVEREAQLAGKVRALETQRASFEDELNERLGRERVVLQVAEAKKAREALSDELARAESELASREHLLQERDRKLAEARRREIELLRLKQELETGQQELELSVQRRVEEQSGKLRDDARRAADEDSRLRMAEKDKIISDMQVQVEALRRKSETSSQQLQGEVLELQLEAQLRMTFHADEIEPVAKGERGADVLQRVLGPNGARAGTILWETKRAKNFQPLWLDKLREDQREAHAEIAVLVSQTLPEGIVGFGNKDGVWLATPATAMPLAACLRHTLVEVAIARAAVDGVETKMELVYQYLTGPRFHQRIEAIVDSFQTMQEDLDKERRAITKQWAKREQQLARALRAAAGMHGDLQGIAGKSVAELDGLDLKSLEGPSLEDEVLS